MKKAEIYEVYRQMNEVAKVFQGIAGLEWSVRAIRDDRFEFRHKEFQRLTYSIGVHHFDKIDGRFQIFRAIEFGSVSSRGSFMMEDRESFAYYALIGALMGYKNLEELNNTIKAIPFCLDEEE